MFHAGIPLPLRAIHHCEARIIRTHLFIAGNGYGWQDAWMVQIGEAEFIIQKLSPMRGMRDATACTTINENRNNKLMVVGGDYPGYSTHE